MIFIFMVFLGIAWFEWNYLKDRGRKRRTYWLAGGCLLLAFLYLSTVHVYKGFPSPNRLIEFVFHGRAEH